MPPEALILLLSQFPEHPLRRRTVSLEMVSSFRRKLISMRVSCAFILVQSKALAGAKSFGSFLYSAVNKAGETVTKASAKIKKTVEDNVRIILGCIFDRNSTCIFYF